MSQKESAAVRVRHAHPSETAAVASVVNAAFAKDLSGELPHLFRPERLPNHLVGEVAGRIVGVVGLYPHQWRCGNVVFDVAGVGQVATLPESRGSGVMSAVLRETCRESDQLDFTWLFGDRLRYSRYGWILGGERRIYEFYDKYLPTPPPREAVTVGPAKAECERIAAAFAHAPQAPIFPAEELPMILEGSRGHSWLAWRMGETFALTDKMGETVLAADGSRKEIALLLAHLAREVRSLPGNHWKIAVVCDAAPSPLHGACLDHYWHAQIDRGANLRIGRLQTFFTKAFAVAQPRIGAGDGRLALRNTDTGEAVTLTCAAGRLSVAAGAGADAIALNTRDLSEIVFGVCPVDLILPDLPAASPFRQAFPLKVYMPEVFSL